MTKHKRPTYWQFIDRMDKMGIRYFASGILRKNGVKYGDYFKTDDITPAIAEDLKKEFGEWVEIKKCQKQYAPEIQKKMLILVSIPEMKSREKK